ncbi:MAG: AbrB/MazE/SpoVT family DNA-binding domain-containing protein [Thermoplasmata archaeon]|nr:AbrB/MazE/SpoVT family DNA-binding domain-containing protein [Thermoplasmata archaeon]
MAYPSPNRERRILKAGHSSIAVTLPKPWAEAMNLRPGDIVVFDQHNDGTLFLKPAPPAGVAPVAAPFLLQARSFDTPGLLTRLVIGAYRVGHDAIEIRTDTPLSAERLEELQTAARGLLGVSVVAQDPGRVVLQNFIDPSKYGLPQLVQRMKMILVAFLEEAGDSVARHRRSKRLPSLEEEASKVLALLVRQLFLGSRDWSLARRIGSPDPRQLLEWRVVVQALEELTSELSIIAREGEKAPRRKGEGEVVTLLTEIGLGLRQSVEAIMHPELSSACEAYSEALRLRAGAAESRGRGSRARDPVLLAAERASRGLATLAEVALDRAVAGVSEAIFLDAP